MPDDVDIPVTWPPGLTMKPLALSWDAPAEPPAGSVSPVSARALGPIASVQGIALAVTLIHELGQLVRIELRGPLDAFALAALGCTPDNLIDEGYHRMTLAGTRVTIDALDGLITLEPDQT